MVRLPYDRIPPKHTSKGIGGDEAIVLGDSPVFLGPCRVPQHDA